MATPTLGRADTCSDRMAWLLLVYVLFSQFVLNTLQAVFTGGATSTRNSYYSAVILRNTLRLANRRPCVPPWHPYNAHVHAGR